MKNLPTIFIGTDPRSMISCFVCMSSIARHASGLVKMVPLIGELTECDRTSLTSFTYARYLVPHFENYEGVSMFMDSDIIVRGDVMELFDMADETSVQVVKKPQKFEWPAVMLFKNDRCQKLTPDYVEYANPQSFEWATDGIGDLPEQWGYLVDYDDYPPVDEPKLIHYTSGTPAFLECRSCDYADLWREELDKMLSTCSWLELMGNSVHTQKVMKRLKNERQDYLECDQPRLQTTVPRSAQL